MSKNLLSAKNYRPVGRKHLREIIAGEGWPVTVDYAERMARELIDLRNHVKELDSLFQLQWQRSQKAIEHWRAAHPGNDLVVPDLGKLLEWLMERASL